jgi:RNA polymerase sigma-70 factor (ECF subfamily)
MDEFDQQLIQIRCALTRSARRKLGNPDWADDAVSETLLVALERRPEFHEPGRVHAWLFGVLRHKMVDQLRRYAGDGVIHAVGGLRELDEIQSPDPDVASDPVLHAGRAEFLAALELQLDALPHSQARAFVMRECWGLSTAEVCSELDWTEGNLWVVMHRVRHRLREGMAAHRETA